MAKKNLKKGVFITLEGPEGCGKTTHSNLLYSFLKRSGYDCIHTREPGGTRVGEKIRQMLLKLRDINISDLTEVFLFEASRAQIVSEVIRPSLAKKQIVICDRFSDATIGYQGYGGKISIKTIEILNNIATGGLKPDLTIILDVDTITGLKRARAKGIDRMEKKDVAYHKRVRAGYLALARKEPERIKVIKVEKDKLATQEKIRRIVMEVICHFKI